MTVLRCPHCGGEVEFDPQGQNVRCEYCGSEITLEDYRNYLDSKGLFQANELVCRQCGATIISTDSTVATFCSYCGSSLVLDSQIKEEKKPDLIIPFRVKRGRAVNIYKDRIRKTLLAPDWMSDDENISKIRGIYMPFHIFRYYGTGSFKGTAESFRVERSNGKKYDVTRTYSIEAPAEIDYDIIPVDASASFPDTMSRALSPYGVSNITEFQVPYLAGYYADGTDVQPRVYEDKYDAIVQSDIAARNDLRTQRMNVPAGEVLDDIKVERSVRTALFPAWFLSFRNRDRISYAAVNGNTGELAADIPIDFRKYLTASLIVAGLFSLIFNLLFTITPIRLMQYASLLSGVVFFVADRLLDDTYRQKKRLDDPGYTGVDTDKVKVRKGFDVAAKIAGGCLVGFAAMLFSILFVAFFSSGTFIAGVVPFAVFMVILVKVIIQVQRPVLIKRKKANVFYKFLILVKPVLAILACAYVAAEYRNTDMACYAAGLFSILMTILTAFDIVREQNKLTMRDLPLFTQKRGGDM